MLWIEDVSSAPFYGVTTWLPHVVLSAGKQCFAVLVGCVTGLGRHCVDAMLTKWFSSTRLETRTKESNIYASIWVENPGA